MFWPEPWRPRFELRRRELGAAGPRVLLGWQFAARAWSRWVADPWAGVAFEGLAVAAMWGCRALLLALERRLVANCPDAWQRRWR